MLTPVLGQFGSQGHNLNKIMALVSSKFMINEMILILKYFCFEILLAPLLMVYFAAYSFCKSVLKW